MKKGDTKGQRLKIAIDDFGTGLSNMDLVNIYEPDIVKLDRLLICDIDKITESRKMSESFYRNMTS